MLQAAIGVLAAAIISEMFYVFVLDISRGGLVRWPQIVEGVLIGAAVVGVWLLARSRVAAATGLGLALVLIGVGAAGVVGLALPFAQNPLGWAVVVALVARLAVPHRDAATT